MKLSYFLILTSIFLFSCSVSKQISKQADAYLLRDSAISTGHIGICIYEPATGKYWYNYHADKFFIPASNTKLFSLYAGMKYLGDSLPGFKYALINDTTVSILPTGDPTFLHPDFKIQKGFDFLKKFKTIEIFPSIKDSRPSYGNGWAWNDYLESYMPYRSNFPIYGNLANFKLVNNHIDISPSTLNSNFNRNIFSKNKFEIKSGFASNDFWTVEGTNTEQAVPFYPELLLVAKMLTDTLKTNARVEFLFSGNNYKAFHSQPSNSLFTLMMHRSDNFFAEQTLLMASNEKLGFMSDSKMIDYILQNDLKDIPQKPKWIDGSGLSRYNLFTPKDFVYILQKLKNDFGFDRMKMILPTGGTGTLSSLYKKDSGYIFAKTGTLSNNAALSGYLITKRDRLLIFSIITNNFITAATPVRKAVEKFLSNIRQRY